MHRITLPSTPCAAILALLALALAPSAIAPAEVHPPKKQPLAQASPSPSPTPSAPVSPASPATAHPGTRPLALTERDLGLIQVSLWQIGYEDAMMDVCRRMGGKSCRSDIPHADVMQGSDPETIRLWFHYSATPGNLHDRQRLNASVQCARIVEFINTRSKPPSWLKLERRDNDGTVKDITSSQCLGVM